MIFLLIFLMVFEVIVCCKSFNFVVVELYFMLLVISYQVVCLEKLLGLCLFECFIKGVELMLVGQSYFNCVVGVFGVINLVIDDLWYGVENLLQIYFSLSFVSLWLMLCIGCFMQCYLEIVFGLLVLLEIFDFEIGQVDLDICCGVLYWLDLEIELVLLEQVILMVSLDFFVCYCIEILEDLVLVLLIQLCGSLL